MPRLASKSAMFETRSRTTVRQSARAIGLRRTRVDAYRVYAMLFVILGHSEMAIGRTLNDWVLAVQLSLNVAGRFAVPLFLLLAGNHLGPTLVRHRSLPVVWPYARRLLGMFAVASLLYWLFDAAKLVKGRGLGSGLAEFAARVLGDPVAIALYGARPHLWFLIGLVLTVLFAALLLGWVRVRTFVAASVLLYVAGLAIGPYGAAFGIRFAHLGPDWFLQAPLFFALGLMLSFELPRPRQTAIGWGLAIGGALLHAVEVEWIWMTYGTSPFRLAMLAGTVPFAVGVGTLALRPGATPLDRLAARAAAYVPAVYLNHVFFLEVLRPPRGAFKDVAVRLALPVATILCAFGSAWLVARLRTRLRRRPRASAAVPDAPTS